MELDSTTAVALGAAAGLVAGAVALGGLVAAVRREGRLSPQRLMKATALRFGLTLIAAVALALTLERPAAIRAIVGLAASYAVLLVIETRWALARSRGDAAGDAGSEQRRRDVGQ